MENPKDELIRLLNNAICKGSIHLVEELILTAKDTGVDIINNFDAANCWASIHTATMCCKYGNNVNEDILRLLIKHGGNVNLKTRNYNVYERVWYVAAKSTPLHIAIDYEAPPDILMFLLESGALLNEKNDSELLPLDIAVQRIVSNNTYPDKVDIRLKNLMMLVLSGAEFSPVNLFPNLEISRCKFEFNLACHALFNEIDLLKRTGYRFVSFKESHNNHINFKQDGNSDAISYGNMTFALSLYRRSVLTLQDLASNVVRKGLKPNAWVGLNCLNIPTVLMKMIKTDYLLSTESVLECDEHQQSVPAPDMYPTYL